MQIEYTFNSDCDVSAGNRNQHAINDRNPRITRKKDLREMIKGSRSYLGAISQLPLITREKDLSGIVKGSSP